VARHYVNRDIINDITQIQTEWSEARLVGTAKAAGLAKAVRESLAKLAINSNLSPRGTGQESSADFPKLQLFVDTAREELNA
jgi:gamma-glutamyl:cysteine ligase YbdK (ATP-grasp superfamily)